MTMSFSSGVSNMDSNLNTASLEFLRVIEDAPTPILLYDEDGEIVIISKVLTDITGYEISEIPTMQVFINKTCIDGKQQAAESIESLFSSGQKNISRNFPICTKDGRKLTWDFYPSYVGQLNNGRKLRISIAIDVTLRNKLENELLHERNLLETTLVSVADGVITTDRTGSIVLMNKAAEILTGWTWKEAESKPVNEVFHIVDEKTEAPVNDIVTEILKTGKINEVGNHILLLSKEGTKRPVEKSAAPIKLDNGEIAGVVIVFRDISVQLQKEKEIEFLSYHDQLTGLYNRRFYEEEMNRLDTERNYPIALIMADANGLKLTNDAFGHIEGDQLLVRLAQTLRKECRSDDIVARIGGDEFIILLPRTSEEKAKLLIDRINKSIAEQKPSQIPLSVSLGMAVKTDEAESLNIVFKRAEDEMYRNKLSESSRMKAQTINLIMNSLFEKNKEAMEHYRRVSELCEELALELHFEKEEVEQIKTAGLMYDIGKIGIDERILNKPRKLTESEWHEVMKHPEIGYRILCSVKEFSEIADYVLQHQERWDGKGYPKGLRGKEISIQARIIGLAAAYVAMTSQRGYSELYNEDKAAHEIKEYAGRQFDPDIAKVFVEKVLGKRW